MPIEIKTTAQIAEKWERVTPGRVQEYEDGVRNTRKDWAERTVAARQNWIRGIQLATQERRWEGGVQRAGTAKWKRKTLEKGPNRWSVGVSQSGNDFAIGYDPYRDAISNIDLPDRFPRGDPRNLERVRAITETLHELRLELQRRG